MATFKIKKKENLIRNTNISPSKSNRIEDILNIEIKFWGNTISNEKKEKFYSDLNILLSSGLDIKSSLELIESEQEKKVERLFFKKLKENIISGKSLSESLNETNKFTAYEIYSINIGEESGKLKDVLTELSKYYSGKIKQKRQLISALSYPIVVILTAFGAIYFMMGFIVPMFSDVFLRFGGELPFITIIVLKISSIVSQYAIYILLISFFCLSFIYKYRKKTEFKKISSIVLLKTPVLGKLIQDIYLARFCHIMGLLTSAKVPVLSSVKMVSKMIGFYPIETTLIYVEADILLGLPLNVSLSKHVIYSKRLISLIKVGEETNQLEEIFKKISEQLNNEVEHKTNIISSLLEPFLIIFLAMVVGIILIAMYLPMFNLSSGLI